MEFRNPLSIKLKLSSVRVICEFEPLPSSFDESLAPTTTSFTDASHATKTAFHSHPQSSKQPQESSAADAAGLFSNLLISAASQSTATATPVAFQGLGPLQPTLSTASSCDSDDEHHRTASSSASPGSRVLGVSTHGTSAAVAGQGRVAQHHVQVGESCLSVRAFLALLYNSDDPVLPATMATCWSDDVPRLLSSSPDSRRRLRSVVTSQMPHPQFTCLFSGTGQVPSPLQDDRHNLIHCTSCYSSSSFQLRAFLCASDLASFNSLKLDALFASSSVQIVDDKFTLHPGESLVEPLRVVPLVAGWLRVLGVSWVLNDGVEGRVLFEPKGKLRKKPKGPRCAPRPYSVNQAVFMWSRPGETT